MKTYIGKFKNTTCKLTVSSDGNFSAFGFSSKSYRDLEDLVEENIGLNELEALASVTLQASDEYQKNWREHKMLTSSEINRLCEQLDIMKIKLFGKTQKMRDDELISSLMRNSRIPFSKRISVVPHFNKAIATTCKTSQNSALKDGVWFL